MAKTRSLPDKYYDKDYEHNGIHRVPLWRIACFALNNTATNLYMMMMGYATYYLMGWVGVGMMMAVEFFSDEYGYEFSKEMYNQHVIISGTLNNSKSIRFEPPVSLTPEEIAKILDASDKAAAKAKEVFGL